MTISQAILWAATNIAPEEKASVPIPKVKEVISVPIVKREAAGLFLDEKSSLAGLFRLFREKMGRDNYAADNVHLGLFSFETKMENYIMFKKPFRVLLAHFGPSQSPSPFPAGMSSNPVSSSRYLLIHEVTADGAILVDAEGKNRPGTRAFLQSHWGQKVSWVYPYENKNVDLSKGMEDPGVLRAQKTLKKMGYPVEITGIYDESTFRNIMKFQAFLGLMPDGIVGPRTKALLYQMSD